MLKTLLGVAYANGVSVVLTYCDKNNKVTERMVKLVSLEHDKDKVGVEDLSKPVGDNFRSFKLSGIKAVKFTV